MESMGIHNCPSGLELTIATPTPAPAPADGLHISSSSASGDGINGSNIENARELALLDMFNNHRDRPEPEVDAQPHAITAATGVENRPPPVADVGGSSSQPRKYNRLSSEQFDTLEATFQKNHVPDQETMRALACTLKVTLKKVQVWFVNRRSRFKRREMVEKEKELDTCKRQVESLTEQTRQLRRKVKKLKKKLHKLKLKQKQQAPSSMAPPPLPPPAAAEDQQQQQQRRQQVMYVPILAGLFTNGEQNGATTVASGNATAALPVTTNALLLPSPGGSNL